MFMDDFSKGKKDMLVVVSSQYVTSLFEEPEGGFSEDLWDTIKELIPENLDVAIDIMVDAKDLNELKLMLTALNKTNKLIHTLQEDIQKLSSELEVIEMENLKRDGKFNSKEWKKLRGRLADEPLRFGSFIYEIILSQSTEESREIKKICRYSSTVVNEYLEILEVNGIVSEEDEDGKREVLVPHVFNLDSGENRIKLYSSLTTDYRKSGLLNVHELLRLTTTKVASTLDQLIKEGWFRRGTEFVKNNDEWWEEWELEHWVAEALSVTH